MDKRRGEIVTAITIGALIVLGISSIISSVFLKNKQTTTTKAAETCECINGTYQGSGCVGGQINEPCSSEAELKCFGECLDGPGGKTVEECNKECRQPIGQTANDVVSNCGNNVCCLTTKCGNKDANFNSSNPKANARQSCTNINNCDVCGGCNSNCCATKDDCPYGFAGQTCGEKDGKDNGYCQTNRSCDWWSDYKKVSEITPTPPKGDPCGEMGGRYYQECCAAGYENHVCQVKDNWYCDYGDGSFTRPCSGQNSCIFPNAKCKGPERKKLPPEIFTPTPSSQSSFEKECVNRSERELGYFYIGSDCYACDNYNKKLNKVEKKWCEKYVTTAAPATENCTITYTNDCTNRGKSAVLCTNGKYRCGDSSTALTAKPGTITSTPATVSTNRCPDNGKDVRCTIGGCASGFAPISYPCMSWWDVCCIKTDSPQNKLLTPIPVSAPYDITLQYDLGGSSVEQAYNLAKLRTLQICDYFGSSFGALGAGDIRNCISVPEANMEQQGAIELVKVKAKPNQKQVACQFVLTIPSQCQFIN